MLSVELFEFQYSIKHILVHGDLLCNYPIVSGGHMLKNKYWIKATKSM